jgi:hypothetical protein
MRLAAFVLFITSAFAQTIAFPGPGMPAQSGRAIAVVQSPLYITSNAPVTSISKTLSTLPTVGSVLAVGVTWQYIATTIAATPCTDNQSPPNTYTLREQINAGGTGFGAAAITAPVVTSSATFTITCSVTTGSYLTLLLHEVGGIPIPVVTDGTDGKNTFLSGAVSPAPCYSGTGIVTTHGNDLIFSVLQGNTGSNVTITPGTSGGTYVLPSNSWFGNGGVSAIGAMEYLIASSAGNKTPEMTVSTGPYTACATVILKGY